MKPLVVVLLCAAFLAAPARMQAQSFNYADFSSVAGLALNGSASQVGNELQITPNLLNQFGSAWYTTRQPVLNGFDAVFTFRMTPSPGASPADGVTFAIHGDPVGTTALNSGAGSFMGYSLLTASLVVEFDTWRNAEFGEASANMVSIHTNGQGPNHQDEIFSLGSVLAPVTMADGLPHQARVEYIPGVLNVYIESMAVPILSVPYDLVTGGTWATGIPVTGLGLPTGTAWVGFTGATGGASEAAHILSWLWGSSPVSLLTLDLSQPAGSGSGRISVTNGTAGALYVTALSLDPLNGTNPGQGWWGGLHITLSDLLWQIALGVDPFVGTLDGSGGALFNTSGLPTGLPAMHAVTHTFDVGGGFLIATSNLASVTLL